MYSLVTLEMAKQEIGQYQSNKWFKNIRRNMTLSVHMLINTLYNHARQWHAYYMDCTPMGYWLNPVLQRVLLHNYTGQNYVTICMELIEARFGHVLQYINVSV